jgi:hypothetical protein
MPYHNNEVESITYKNIIPYLTKGSKISVLALTDTTKPDTFLKEFFSITTTDDTPTEMNYKGITDSKYYIPVGTVYKFTYDVLAVSSNFSCVGWVISGVIKNISGTTSIVGGYADVKKECFDTDLAEITIDILADDTYDYLKPVVTGKAATTIDWNMTNFNIIIYT